MSSEGQTCSKELSWGDKTARCRVNHLRGMEIGVRPSKGKAKFVSESFLTMVDPKRVGRSILTSENCTPLFFSDLMKKEWGRQPGARKGKVFLDEVQEADYLWVAFSCKKASLKKKGL